MTRIKNTPDKSLDAISDGLYVTTTTGYRIKISPGDILYLKAEGDYTIVVTEKRDYLKTCQLGNLLEKLTSYKFLRVHQSYAVNVAKFAGIKKGHIVINSVEIPIGRVFKDSVYNYLDKS